MICCVLFGTAVAAGAAVPDIAEKKAVKMREKQKRTDDGVRRLTPKRGQREEFMGSLLIF